MAAIAKRKRNLSRNLSGWDIVWIMFILITILLLAACSPNRVYFPAVGVPVQLLTEVEGVEVSVREAETGQMVRAKATLPVGAWILFDPGELSVEERANRMNLERQ